MPPVPRKQGDTWEPVSGTAYEADGSTPADLRGATLRFLAKYTQGGVTYYIDGGNALHGTMVNVEDETSNVADRGKWEFHPLTAGVSQAGLFATELKATKDGKTLTFPSRESNNPQMQIDPSIVPPA